MIAPQTYMELMKARETGGEPLHTRANSITVQNFNEMDLRWPIILFRIVWVVVLKFIQAATLLTVHYPPVFEALNNQKLASFECRSC